MSKGNHNQLIVIGLMIRIETSKHSDIGTYSSGLDSSTAKQFSNVNESGHFILLKS